MCVCTQNQALGTQPNSTLSNTSSSIRPTGILFLLFFPIPFITFALLSFPSYEYSSSRNSGPRSHSRSFFPPAALRFVPCIFIARRFQLFFRPWSTRVELCLYPCYFTRQRLINENIHNIQVYIIYKYCLLYTSDAADE